MYDKNREAKFQEVKARMMEKYKKNLENFSKYHGGLETYICWDMLFCNAKCFANGVTKNIVPGGGAVNVPELVEDYKELAKYILWQ